MSLKHSFHFYRAISSENSDFVPFLNDFKSNQELDVLFPIQSVCIQNYACLTHIFSYPE